MSRGVPVTPEVVNELLEMHSAGMTPQQIVSELAISSPTVYMILREHGLLANRKRVLDDVDVDAMMVDYYLGLPLRSICRKYNVDNNSIYNEMNRRGGKPRNLR